MSAETPARCAVENTYQWRKAMLGLVPPMELALVLVLGTHMNTDGTLPLRFTPSIDTLTAEMGLAKTSRKTVIRLIQSLEERGYLDVTRAPKGSKRVNRYRATLPGDRVYGVAEEPAHTHRQVVEEPASGGPSAPLPSPSNQNPPNPAAAVEADGNDATELANQILFRALDRLPRAEADAVLLGVSGAGHRRQLAQLLVALSRAGLEDQVVDEMTAIKLDGCMSPYQGSKHPSRVLWGRVKAFYALAAAQGHVPLLRS